MADEGKLDHLAGVDEKYDVPKEPAIIINSKTRNKEIDKVVEIIS